MAEMAIEPAKRGGRSWLLWLGLAGLILCEGLLAAHVRNWLPVGRWEWIGAQVRANMTPVAWCFYLVLLLGAVGVLDGRSYLRRFRNRFLVCWLWAVPAWCYFDWMKMLSKHPIICFQSSGTSH